MTRILLHGYAGKMGRMIASASEDRDDITIAAGVDALAAAADFPVFSSLDAVDVPFDVAVDFSRPGALEGLLTFCEKKQCALIVCTTGFSETEKQRIADAAKRIPLFWSANMSLGINIMAELIKKAALATGDAFDIEIIEKHHNQKVDAPSGTAYLLADAINSALDEKKTYVYDRHSVTCARTTAEIGISSVRGGTLPGEHQVLFIGPDEVIEITHIAQSRRIFALGALRAAAYMHGKEAGLYSMRTLLEEES